MSNYSAGIKTKQKIELTARYLFFTNGFEETTYTKIAEAANVNVGSIAYHYNSLNSLADGIYNDILKERSSVIKWKIANTFDKGEFSNSALSLVHYRINTQAYIDYPNYARFVAGRLFTSPIWGEQAVNSTITSLCTEYGAKISKNDLDLEKYLYVPFSLFATTAVNNGVIDYSAKEICDYQLHQRLKSLEITDENIDFLIKEIDSIADKIRLNVDCYMHITIA